MNIYQGRYKVGRLPTFRIRAGEVLSRLDGVNLFIRDGQIVAEPVYIPFLKFTKHGGILAIDINFSEPFAVILLFPHFPYFSAIRVQGELHD